MKTSLGDRTSAGGRGWPSAGREATPGSGSASLRARVSRLKYSERLCTSRTRAPGSPAALDPGPGAAPAEPARLRNARRPRSAGTGVGGGSAVSTRRQASNAPASASSRRRPQRWSMVAGGSTLCPPSASWSGCPWLPVQLRASSSKRS